AIRVGVPAFGKSPLADANSPVVLMEGDPAAAKSDLAFPKVPCAFVQGDRAVASSPFLFPKATSPASTLPSPFQKGKGSLPKGRGLLQKARGELGKAPVLLPKDEAFTKKTLTRPAATLSHRVGEGRYEGHTFIGRGWPLPWPPVWHDGCRR